MLGTQARGEKCVYFCFKARVSAFVHVCVRCVCLCVLCCVCVCVAFFRYLNYFLTKDRTYPADHIGNSPQIILGTARRPYWEQPADHTGNSPRPYWEQPQTVLGEPADHVGNMLGTAADHVGKSPQTVLGNYSNPENSENKRFSELLRI